MSIQETFVQLAVVLGFAIWAYSAVVGQSFGDTVRQIKEFINSMNEE